MANKHTNSNGEQKNKRSSLCSRVTQGIESLLSNGHGGLSNFGLLTGIAVPILTAAAAAYMKS